MLFRPLQSGLAPLLYLTLLPHSSASCSHIGCGPAYLLIHHHTVFSDQCVQWALSSRPKSSLHLHVSHAFSSVLPA